MNRGTNKSGGKAGENLHSGHRERLRERFLREGIKGFDDHSILELLLFYTIPRCDTNELAHRLLNTFGSLSAVLDADMEALEAVPGIGKNSAFLLKLMPAISKAYRTDKFFPDKKPMGMIEIAEYLTEYYADKSEEVMVAVMLDNSGRIICLEELFHGSVDSVELDGRSIFNAVVSKKAASVVIAHNHPRGRLEPSGADMKTTDILKQLFSTAGIKLKDHLLIAGEGWLSIFEYEEINCTRYEPVYYFEPQKVTILPTKGKPKKRK